MTTTTLSDGIYRIQVVGGAQSQYLTREKESDAVTILAPNAQSDPEQEWQIINADIGNIIIKRPLFVPGDYLTYYKGPFNKKPEPGDRIICHPSDRPPNEWQVVSGNIRVAGSDLGIKVAPLPIYPPILELGPGEQLDWGFVRVRDV